MAKKTCSPSLKKWGLHIILLVVILIVFFILSSEYSEKNSETFLINDQCGPLPGGVISHSIEDESVCRVQCRGLCDSKDLDLKNHIFEKSPDACHSCNCICG